jgi:hypothetical protein
MVGFYLTKDEAKTGILSKKCDCCGWNEIDVKPIMIRGKLMNLCKNCIKIH